MVDTQTPLPPHAARLVGWLSVGQLISWGSVFYLFALLMVPVEQALGLTRTQSSLAFSLALLFEGLLAYPVGRWIDQGHERLVMTGGSLLLAAGLALHSFVTQPLGFYAVWALLGAGMAATLYTPVFAVLTRRYAQHYRRAIITMTFLGGLASTVFIPLIAGLMQWLGWRGAVLVLAGMHLAFVAPLHWRCLAGAPRRGALPKHAQDPETARPPSAPSSVGGSPPGDTLAEHLNSVRFLLVGGFVVLSMAVTAALPTHMVSLLRESGMGEHWAIAVPAAIGAVQVLGRLLLYFFERRIPVHTANRVIPCLVPLALACLLVALAAAHSTLAAFHALAPLLVCGFVVLWGVGNGLLTIVKGTAVAQYVSHGHAASLNGALGLPLALSRAAAPLALGWLWSAQAGYRHGVWMLLVLGVAGVLALWAAQHAVRRSTV